MLVSSATVLRLRRLLRLRITTVTLLLFCLVNFLDVARIHHKLGRSEHHVEAERHHVHARSGQRVYIASMHFNDAVVLRAHWSKAVVELIQILGPQNVFLSISESGSWDGTKDALRELDAELESMGVARRIEISDKTHKDELEQDGKGEGWIDTPKHKRVLRRIPYLAKLRNKTLQDLLDLHQKGVKFDKVLFLNDVIFMAQDVLTLMETNHGEYAAACSLDFAKPPEYYDTFALRDIEGNAHITKTWPFFKARISRNALVANMDAVPVSSCWNGIVVMPAEPFISSTALRFRGIPDSLAEYHLEGSECCLIHADNPLSKTLGVYLNPRVRVAYNAAAFAATHPRGSWVSAWHIFKGIWSNRLKRWTLISLERSVVRTRLWSWARRQNHGETEPGVFCLINEMQVLVERGWAHV